MSDLEWFAFVFLPLGVTVFGALLASGGVWLINRADRPQVLNRETGNRTRSASEAYFWQSYTLTTTFSPRTGWATRRDDLEPDLFDDETRRRAH